MAFSPFVACTATFLTQETISTSLRRVTFTGDFAAVHYLGRDQRAKLIFPAPSHEPFAFPVDIDWYQAWKQANHTARGMMRTYTVKGLSSTQLTIDFACHEPADSPAMRWLTTVKTGASITAVLPVKQHTEFVRPRLLGIEWNPSDVAKDLAVYADITALPAAFNIVTYHSAQQDTRPLTVYVQTPAADDTLELEQLIAQHTTISFVRIHENIQRDTSEPHTLLWDVSEHHSPDAQLYCWIAAERSIVKSLRQQIKKATPTAELSCMGYWRHGESSLD